MKLTVAGYWGGFPAANEATSGYLLEAEGYKLLIDCGSAVVSQIQNYVSIQDLDAVVLSHYHFDHAADIGPLQYARLVTGMIHKTSEVLPIYGHAYDKEAFAKLTYKSVTKGIAYNPEKELRTGPFTIRFLKTVHPVPCFAMSIEAEGRKVVYTADSSFQDSFIPFAEGADLLISECSLYKNQDGSGPGHLNSIEAGVIAQQARARTLLLSHLPHFGSHSDLIIQAESVYGGRVLLAKSGLTWTGA
ncbi:MBL fold metallo-hydrolase [Metabacillus sp. GX 13764]|uniref:MBL fold metallo-hydrolase n=1 Tax=Metabacillus kandeliae TaxID=2900151 RepID=UPI001E40280D|nr:MBL fold metallo-hydrolase [Metabacillus kandeliae]MCD7034874.1 MBL fold metallo-hydrolase [Metabacillus kandeliae]